MWCPLLCVAVLLPSAYAATQVDVTGKRMSFDVTRAGREACDALVSTFVEKIEASRPPAHLNAAAQARFFKDELRADDLVEQVVWSTVQDYHFVDLADDDPRRQQGRQGLYLKYSQLLAMEGLGQHVRETLADEMKSIDPRLHNFLRVLTQEHEEAIAGLIMRDVRDADQWRVSLCRGL